VKNFIFQGESREMVMDRPFHDDDDDDDDDDNDDDDDDDDVILEVDDGDGR